MFVTAAYLCIGVFISPFACKITAYILFVNKILLIFDNLF